jgi:hypothetical protein
VVMEAIDFDCGECGAKPGQGCVYLPPTGQVFELSYYDEDRGRWAFKEVSWTRGKPFVEDFDRAAKSLDPKRFDVQRREEIPQKWRQTGQPIRAAGYAHSTRRRTVSEAEWRAEKSAMNEYLREWLAEFGDIFQESA